MDKKGWRQIVAAPKCSNKA